MITPLVPSDEASIFDALSTLQTANGEPLALVRPNSPAPGIAGFLFGIDQDTEVNLESDITDHYTESNRSIQDHIALRPETIRLRGLVAEVTSRTEDAQVTLDLPAAPRLGDNGMGPDVSPSATQTRTVRVQASIAESVTAANASSLYGYYLSRLPQQPNTSRQSQAFNFFYQLWLGRQLFTVETPFGIFTSMALASLSARQDEDDKWHSEFTISFKRIRTVASAVITPTQLSGRLVYQGAAPVSGGTLTQTKLPQTGINKIYSDMAASYVALLQ